MVAPLQHFGHLAVDDLARQALGDGGLADAGVADQQRVVLVPAAQDLDAALAPRSSRPISGSTLPWRALLVEVDAIGFERLAASLHRRLLVLALRRLAPLTPLAASDAPGLLAMPWAMKLTAS